jgi:hypothetical protein
MRAKHRRDGRHGKSGLIGGNPRFGYGRGSNKGQRAKVKRQTGKEIANN